MLRWLVVATLTSLALGHISAAVAQTEVTLLEEKAAKKVAATDRIDTTQIAGRFRAIRIYALGGTAVDIARIDILYSDGTKFTEDRGKPIRLGEAEKRTRAIGPDQGRGAEKFIDQIVLHYTPPPGESQQARLRIVGLASPQGARAQRPTAAVAAARAAPAADHAVIASTAPATGTTRALSPSAGGEVMFGAQSIGFGIDRDIIRIGAELGRFDKIRLRVLDNELFIQELRVVYASDEPDIIAVGTSVPANGRTRWFALKGDRFIKEIQLVYKSRPEFRGQARVEAYGEYADDWHGPPAATPAGAGTPIQPTGAAFQHSANRGWLYLGGQQPLFFSVKKGLGYETDTVAVARNWGFNRLRLSVRDRAITLNRLTIAYADGTSETVPVTQKVDAGSGFGPINLRPKPIKEIQVSYRSRLLDGQAKGKSYAFVEFWVQ